MIVAVRAVVCVLLKAVKVRVEPLPTWWRRRAIRIWRATRLACCCKSCWRTVHFAEVAPGRGQIDYAAYLKALTHLPVDAPLMLEHLKNAEEYDGGRAYIQKVARQEGVPFA